MRHKLYISQYVLGKLAILLQTQLKDLERYALVLKYHKHKTIRVNVTSLFADSGDYETLHTLCEYIYIYTMSQSLTLSCSKPCVH